MYVHKCIRTSHRLVYTYFWECTYQRQPYKYICNTIWELKYVTAKNIQVHIYVTILNLEAL